ncbi:MAG TPA: tripartite tricarboxylate transporter substrate binding protein [Noviherbaspirillum sp.]|nr:tripartite tricarboxylate transporter substrate binding protein [Noviherbaspirillum sp.]
MYKTTTTIGFARKAVLAMAAAAAMLPLTTSAQSAPQEGLSSRPITLIVPFPPGGPLDSAARILAEAVRPTLGTVVVENRSGAGGNIGMEAVAKAAPDGHTIGIGALSTHAINPWLYTRMPFDPVKDFAPITLITDLPNVLVLSTSFAEKNKINTVADFVTYLKANPGKINYGSGGNGSGGHLAAELFKQMAGVFMVHIPYRGAAPAQTALLSGEVDVMFDNLGSAAPRIRDGQIKALAVTTTKRSAMLPDVPTVAESGVAGFKDFHVSTWFGLFAPAGVQPAIINRLNKEFTAAMRTPAVKERMSRIAAEPSPTTPAQFGDLVKRELARYEGVVKRSGAKVD